MGMIELFFQDRSRVLGLLITVLTIILSAVIIFSVRTCVSSSQSTGRSVTVTTPAESEDKKDEKENVSAEEEQRAREEATAAKVAENEAAVASRTIEVTVADGEVTWLEIEYDGASDIAETVTGPWNRTYTVRQSITVNVNDTTAVTVTEDGKKLEFDSKASSIGTITIQVSKKGDTSNAGDDATGNGQQGDNAQQNSDAQANGNQQGDAAQQGDGQSTQNGEGEQTSQSEGSVTMNGDYELAEDGYYYGPDGYFDPDGNFYEY